MDKCEHIDGVLQQGLKDTVSELHFDKQFILVIVHPLCLFFVEFLNLRNKQRKDL